MESTFKVIQIYISFLTIRYRISLLTQFFPTYTCDNYLDRNIGSSVWNNPDEEKVEITKNKACGMTPALDLIVSHFDNQLAGFMKDLQYLTNSNGTATSTGNAMIGKEALGENSR